MNFLDELKKLDEAATEAPTIAQIEYENTPTECGGTFNAAATLTREQIEQYRQKNAGIAGSFELCDMALRWLDVCEAEPLRVMYVGSIAKPEA